MWSSPADAKGAMYGMFEQLRLSLLNEVTFWGDYRSGLFKESSIGATTSDKLRMFENSLNSTVTDGTNWGPCYTTINDANLILKHVPDIDFTGQETDRNLVLANAYFVRAYVYFYIARVWGDAPIVLSGFESDKDDLFPSRRPVADVLAQVGSDIEEAMALMPESASDCTIGTRDAVLMLKADYHLWMYKVMNASGSLALADNAVSEVLRGKHSLLSSYDEVFNIKNKNNAEMIFVIRLAKGEVTGGQTYEWLVPQSVYVSGDAYVENPVKLLSANTQRTIFTNDYVDLLKADSSDTRTATSWGDWTDESKGVRYTWINKFSGLWENNQRYFISDIPLYRFAEALLFKAEILYAQGKTADALTYLNQIAKRAYGKDEYYSSSEVADFKTLLKNEYLKEFAAEGKAWWIYIRLGEAFNDIKSLHGRQNEPGILLWPVSTVCLNSNPNITQTVGY